MRRISQRRKQELALLHKGQAKVILRDRGVCIRCLQANKRVRAWDIAHIIPRGRSGSKTKHIVHQEKNLICLCRPCHKATETFEGRVELLTLLHKLHGYDYSGPPWDEYV